MTDFPSGWTRRTLGDLGTYMNGMAFKPSDWTSDGLPIIRIQNLMDPAKPFNSFSGNFDSRYRIQDGDLLISWSASLGAFIWDRGEAILNQHIFRVEVNNDLVERHFLYYLVLHMLDEIARHTHGSTMKHITKRKFEALGVSVPSMQEQRRIVGRIQECLTRVGEIHRLRHEVIPEAEALPAAVLEALWDESWPSDLLGRLTTEIRNGWSGRTQPNKREVRMLRLSCVHGLRINTEDTRVQLVAQDVIDAFSLRAGDVFLVRGNGTKRLVGRAAISDSDESGVIFNDLLIRLRFSDRILPEFAAVMSHTPSVRRQIEDLAKTAAGIWKINQRMVRKLRFPCPPLTVQDKVTRQFMRIRKVVDEIDANMSAADPDALMQAVLRKAFAGEF